MLSERAQGLRVLVVIPFSGENGPGALEKLGFDALRLGLPAAPERNDFYNSYTRTTFDRHLADDGVQDELMRRLEDLALRTKARHIYLPLGADGHVDHRLCHDAGLRALTEISGRNVFFYEERPQALLPGAIRMRLGTLGARLPPAAADVRDNASFTRMAVSFNRAPFVAAARLGLLERARATRRMAAGYRQARAWNPTRAFGLRLQPVLDAMDAAEFEGLLGVLQSAEPKLAARFGSREQLAREASRYAKKLAGRAYVERYWLLLPPRDEVGMLSVPAGAAEL
jgi:LmbE family N-acetylglucosaminyl deacetylase